MTPDLKTLRSVAEAVVLAERPFENGQYGSSWQVRALSKARRAFYATGRDAPDLADFIRHNLATLPGAVRTTAEGLLQAYEGKAA